MRRFAALRSARGLAVATSLVCISATCYGWLSAASGDRDGVKLPAIVDAVDLLAPTKQPSRPYRLAISLYAGWMPWYYAESSGILRRRAEAEGIDLVVLDMDYMASIEAYAGGRVDACLMTNIDVLGVPAAAGIDSTALVVGDYSDGNDQVLARDVASMSELAGKRVALAEYSVSDYLLHRALAAANMNRDSLKLTDVGDATIADEFAAPDRYDAVVTWNPIAWDIQKSTGAHGLYDSSEIPGEILDLCIVNSDSLQRDPRLGRVLVGAWYESLERMRRPDDEGRQAVAAMARLSRCTVDDFNEQLASTHMYWDADAAAQFVGSPQLKTNMDRVRSFCFERKLMGDAIERIDDIGIAYPDGAVQGSPTHVRLRFVTPQPADAP